MSPVDPANNRFARVAASAPREADFERPRNEEAFASFAYPRRRDDEYVVGVLRVCRAPCVFVSLLVLTGCRFSAWR